MTTHIFGVDIDLQAVEVTKLSLLLKVLEGEKADTIARQMDLFKTRALPDLGANIRCGNSLIDSHFYKSYSLSLLTEDDKIRLNIFDWDDEFPFFRRSKFDCVIGNPPYLYSAGSEYSAYFQSYYSFSNYQTDFYVYFIERGLALLRKGGAMGYIIPDSWLNSDSFGKMRSALVNEWHLERVCVYKYNVFRSANIENTVFVAQNRKPGAEIPIYEFSSPTDGRLVNTLAVADINRLGILDPGHSKTGEAIISHLDTFPRLKRIVDLNRGIHAYRTDGYGKTAFGHGPQTKRDKDERSYHSTTKRDSTYLPEVRGRDVLWCRYRHSGKYISYGEWLAEPRNPKYILNPKIVFRKTLGNILSAALIIEPAAVDQSLYIAIEKNNDIEILKFVLGVTASSLGAWYLRTKYSIYDKLHPWYTKKHLEDFPIPPASSKIAGIVDKILAAQTAETSAKTEGERRRAAREINVYRRDLDKAVFASFGLSDKQGDFIRAATATGGAAHYTN
ncbi:Eco57I restriction-modification methylase domain-containing protein [Jiella avicenniae]|uniref:site-specific DNA-methyltransferase (adenine-specific) n=1 Tax=Jiella avicenniae TaxID=2907202 RepID=A0A9X1TDZ0_9HYPH|nr:Eco57I restriction-modification methylase domain-containing protein [Jiella avicenniae]MCE7030703.1 Eco57I restriction-modification methylase domain-containing protein [Jiella avicenniae]